MSRPGPINGWSPEALGVEGLGTEQDEVEGEDNVASRGGLEEVMGAAAGRSPEALGRLPGGSRGAVPEHFLM